jgi:formylglycine-generating enzyme required for sulfatase activity
MSGNTQEWVNDWYSKDYYQQSPELDPQGPSTGFKKVMRGWDLTTYRKGEDMVQDEYYSSIGFRCALQQI